LRLSEAFAGSGIRYWVLPIIEHGVM